jgi:hypothetical protein
MQVAGDRTREADGGFEQCYIARAVVAADSLLVVATDVVPATNDKQQFQPMPSKVTALPNALSKITTLLFNNGYFSTANGTACAAVGIKPLIAKGKQLHYPALNERFADAPTAPENPTLVDAMAHRLQTQDGRKLDAWRKQMPEPVSGIIESIIGLRRCLPRRMDAVRDAWGLVTIAWNIKRWLVLCSAD